MAGLQPLDFGRAALEPAMLAQEMDLRREMHPAALAHQQSLARLQRAQASEAEMRLAKSQRFQQLAEGYTPTPGAKPEDMLIDIGNMARLGGDLDLAEKSLAASVQAGQRTAMGEQARAQASLAAARMSAAYGKLLGETYAAVGDPTDPAQIASARRIFLTQAADLPDAEARADAVERLFKENPLQAKAMLSNMSMGQVAAKIAEHRAVMEQIAKDNLKRQQARDAFQRQIQTERLNLRRQIEEDKKKAGGKDVSTPSFMQIAGAKAHLKTLGYDTAIEDADEFSLFARELASSANILRRGNPALTESQSFQQALEGLKEAGAITDKPRKVFNIPVPGTSRGGYDPSKSKPAAATKPAENLPPGIPQGSKPIGWSPDGKRVWQAPDKTQYKE